MKKRNKGLSTIIAVGAVAAYLYFQNFTLGKTSYKLKMKSLPSELHGLKIAQISDLHIPQHNVALSDVVDKVKEGQPDAIFLTGDAINGDDQFQLGDFFDFIKDLVAIAPLYFADGNHEQKSAHRQTIQSLISQAGGHVLNNESAVQYYKGYPFVIMGLAGVTAKNLRRNDVLRDIDLPKGHEANFRFLLAHHPEHFLRYHDNLSKAPNVTFSGHAHGGQVRLPFIGGLFSPGQGYLPQHTEGVFHLPGNTEKKLVISRGIGASGFPIRVNNRPEVIFVTLEKDK